MQWSQCIIRVFLPIKALGVYKSPGWMPERGTFFRLQVDEEVGILLSYLLEVYERVGESVIWVC